MMMKIITVPLIHFGADQIQALQTTSPSLTPRWQKKKKYNKYNYNIQLNLIRLLNKILILF